MFTPSSPSLLLRRGLLFSATPALLKKTGKPTDTPEHKNEYLPYETAPTTSEIATARRRFTNVPHFKTKKPVPVDTVPDNMFTYGKEGMALNIALFKDQKNPVIGPEWSYPGIYENKVALKYQTLDEMLECDRKDEWNSVWQRRKLDNRVRAMQHRMASKMATAKVRTNTSLKDKHQRRTEAEAAEKAKEDGPKRKKRSG